MDPQPSLLHRLRNNPTCADWDLFHELYGRLLRYWARRLTLAQDAEDLTHDVLVRVMEANIPEFTGREDRAVVRWLWRIMRNRWIDTLRRAAIRPHVGTGNVAEPAVPDESSVIDEAEACAFLVRQALDIIRSNFAEHIWRACYEHVAEERSAAEVAVQFAISEANVYNASYRVVRRIRAELGAPEC
jgi:RNA polymerase sigma factor (sigma-70 family)